MSSTKRCHYEVLGLPRECTAEEIRSAYKKLALQLHPDKLIQSGLSHSEATSKFQELSYAYEVLSDPKERAWYDSHRSQILFSDPDTARNSVVPDLFSFFSNTAYSGYSDSGKGFYQIYADVFNRVYANEVNFVRKLGLGLEKLKDAPLMGNIDSPYEQATAFYNYWLGFATVMDFYWVDLYDASLGMNRKSRRVMEEENNKLRKKAKREYNDTVRSLAEFVKKRDKRIINMRIKKNKETEERNEEEKERKKRLEREKLERAKKYEEPEWVKIDDSFGNSEEDDMVENSKGACKVEELYCVVCGKKFKSDKQWKNHEQSKKHKDKVAELRNSFKDDYVECGDWNGMPEFTKKDRNGITHHDHEGIENLFQEQLKVQVEENGIIITETDSENEETNGGGGVWSLIDENGQCENDSEDNETEILEAMLLRHNSRNTRDYKDEVNDIDINQMGSTVMDIVDDENYNGKRTRRKNKKEKGKCSTMGESFKEESDDRGEILDDSNLGTLKPQKAKRKTVVTTGTKKSEVFSIVKSSLKDKKVKRQSKESCNLCQTCGAEFDSRNKLHVHLADSGHASLKYR